MKKHVIKIRKPSGELLWEAMRRIFCMSAEKGLDSNLAGLGCPSLYKVGIQKGFFTPSFGKETPKTANWYKLTPLGQKIIKQIRRKKLSSPQSCHHVDGYVYGDFIVYL